MKKGFFIKSSLLSVAILSGSAGIINATIPKISENFPDISMTSIELLSTIPSITLLIVMLLGEAMLKKVPKKYSILAGIALVAMSGILPIMFEAYFALLLSRLILGIGLGLFSNSTVTLVTELFSEEEQGKMLGYRAALTSIGGAVLVIVGNSLSAIRWNYIFLAYTVAIPIGIYFLIFFPNINNKKDSSKKEQQDKFEKSTGNQGVVLMTVVIVFLLMLLYNGVNVKIAGFVEYKGYGSSSGIAIMFALAGIITMAVSFAFGKLKEKFGDKLFTGAIFIVGISILIINFSNNFILTAGVFFIMSAAVAVLGPLAFARVIEASKSSIQGLNTSFVIVAFQAANLLSPYGLAILMIWTGLESMFLGAAIVIFLLLGVEVIFERIEFRNLKNIKEELRTDIINE